MLNTNNKHAHGHRQRAKAKFKESQKHKVKLLDYEILELLLTFSIPRKDTKPIAKSLLTNFTCFKNIFHAHDEERKAIKDIGASTLAFLNIEHEFIKRAILIDSTPVQKLVKTDTLGTYISFAHKEVLGKEEGFWIICLGNNARFLSCTKIENIQNFDKAFEDMRPFIHAALNADAKSVIIFSNRLNSSLHVSYEELEQSQNAQKLLNTLSIKMHEHIIISGNNAILVLLQKCTDIEEDKDIIKQNKKINSPKIPIEKSINLANFKKIEEFDDYEILSYLLQKAGFKEDTTKIIDIFRQNSFTCKSILTNKINEIHNILSKVLDDTTLEKVFFFINLQREAVLQYLFADYLIKPLSKRKIIENIEDFAHIAYFQLAHCQKEEIWLAHFDANKKLIAYEIVSVQAVALARVDLSYLVARVLHYKSTAVIICHNHPAGSVEASNADITSTKEFALLLKNLGSTLLEHILVADRSCTLILGNKVLYY